MESVEDLQSNLSTYLEQLQQVKELLASDPGNVEYGDMVKELEEAIELTRDLLSSANSDLVSSIAEYQHELGNEIPGRLPPGTKVQAVWTDDGEWYNATIESVTPIGYMVVYDEWGNKEEVEAESIRERLEDGLGGNALLEAERNAEATRQAIKRKIAQAADLEDMHKDLPLKLRIKPEDPEDVKLAKRKKIHAFKSKLRLEQMELVQNKRQNAWHQFQTNKGRSKKVGFFTGRKKESIFKSPDDPKGKVGVTGSGKGITEFHKREKHLHLKVGSEDGEE